MIKVKLSTTGSSTFRFIQHSVETFLADHFNTIMMQTNCFQVFNKFFTNCWLLHTNYKNIDDIYTIAQNRKKSKMYLFVWLVLNKLVILRSKRNEPVLYNLHI